MKKTIGVATDQAMKAKQGKLRARRDYRAVAVERIPESGPMLVGASGAQAGDRVLDVATDAADGVRHTTGGGVLPGTRRVFKTFAVLTLLAANTLLLLAGHTDRYFAWTITGKPIAAFFGSAYAAGFVLSVLALRQDRWDRIRVALVTVTAFTVLTLIATLNHRHILHLTSSDLSARFAAWFWLLVYLAIPVACLVAVAQQRATRIRSAPVRRPMPRWLTALLAGQGLIMLLVGAVLYSSGAMVHHFSPSALNFWPWPVGPLSAQVVGAWLLALGMAAALSISERDLDRLLVPAATYTAFGGFQLLVTVLHWREVRPDDQWTWAYVAVLAMITLTGAYGVWQAAEASHAPFGAAGRRGRQGR